MTRPGGIVELEIGMDLFSAQVIAEAIRTAGFDVRLREMTNEGVALSSVAAHLLLVRADDLEPVREIVHQSFPLD